MTLIFTHKYTQFHVKDRVTSTGSFINHTVHIYDLMPMGGGGGGRIFDCQSNLFQIFCLVVALCVRS